MSDGRQKISEERQRGVFWCQKDVILNSNECNSDEILSAGTHERAHMSIIHFP